MGLVTSISTNEQPKSFLINDCTGEYKSTNPTGWGGLNPRIEDVTESYFEIITPKKEKCTVNVFPDFPNSSGYSMEILPYMVNNPEGIIESGLWKINWVVKGVSKGLPFYVVANHVAVFKDNVFCCVDKHTIKLDKNISTSPEQKAIVEMKNIMQATNYAIEKGMFETANKNIEYLKLNCDNCC